MKKLFTCLALSFLALAGIAATPTSIHQFSVMGVYGDTIDMSQYYGKKLMVVNVASYCAYTPQYEQLQQIYDLYSQQYHFEIIGFPCDDFGHQAGTDSNIVDTCASYDITFPITETVKINSTPVHPVYDWLKKSSLNGVSNASVSWNFNKFLVDEAGHWVAHYTQSTLPTAQAIVNWIMSPSVISSAPVLNEEELVEITSPNPTGSSIDFTIKNSRFEHYNISVYSNQGQLVSTIFDGIAAVEQNISYPVSSLASGNYFIKVQSETGQKTYRYSVIR